MFRLTGENVTKKCMAIVLAAMFLAACTNNTQSDVQNGVQNSVQNSTHSAGSSAVAAAPPTAPVAPVPAAAPPGALVANEAVNSLTGVLRPPEAIGRRPAALVVTNSARGRPQRGLALADVLVEMLAKADYTSFLALYDHYAPISTTGPVSETFDQFVQFALPLNAIQMHTSESPYAQNLIAVTGATALNGTKLGALAFGFDFARTTPRPGGKLNEYCWFTDGALIANAMATMQLPETGQSPPLFLFGENTLPQSQMASTVVVAFSEQARADFTYDVNSNQYYKYVDGAFHTDEDGAHLVFTNLLVLNANIGQKEDAPRYLSYDFSAGSGWYFFGGKVTAVRWLKGSPSQPLRIVDEAGNDIAINSGKSYVAFVPTAKADAVAWMG